MTSDAQLRCLVCGHALNITESNPTGMALSILNVKNLNVRTAAATIPDLLSFLQRLVAQARSGTLTQSVRMSSRKLQSFRLHRRRCKSLSLQS